MQDNTLYDDGRNFEASSIMLKPFLSLLEKGYYVAIVTAAGYPNNPQKYEHRIRGLLEEMKKREYKSEMLRRFYLMGGECNYLHRVNENYQLEYIVEDHWKVPIIKKWTVEMIATYFDQIATFIAQVCNRLRIQHKTEIIRKEKAIGLITKESFKLTIEVLNEVVFSVEDFITTSGFTFPYCCFNSGSDV